MGGSNGAFNLANALYESLDQFGEEERIAVKYLWERRTKTGLKKPSQVSAHGGQLQKRSTWIPCIILARSHWIIRGYLHSSSTKCAIYSRAFLPPFRCMGSWMPGNWNGASITDCMAAIRIRQLRSWWVYPWAGTEVYYDELPSWCRPMQPRTIVQTCCPYTQ